MSLSLCMIVKNEERCILRCLESVKDIVTQFIIVDTGSTDRTIPLIESFKEKYPSLEVQIHSFTWVDDFSAARNFALDHAKGEYIFTLDADEYINPSDINQFKKLKKSLLKSTKIVWFRFFNVRVDGIPMYEDRMRVCRIFPNRSDLRYSRKIHEVLDFNEKYNKRHYNTDIKILHDGYDWDGVDVTSKRQRNLLLLNKAFQENPDDTLSLFYFARDLFMLNPIKSLDLMKRVVYPMLKDEGLKKECLYYIDRFTEKMEQRLLELKNE